MDFVVKTHYNRLGVKTWCGLYTIDSSLKHRVDSTDCWRGKGSGKQPVISLQN